MKIFVAAALMSAAVIAGPAYAQTADRAAPTATTTDAAGTKMMLKGKWRASKLMGLDVYNEANEKLGDVNELILDKDGKINAVVIGVGGFLGMGEHDIAVTMDKLKFMETPVRTSSTAPAGTVRETTTSTARQVRLPRPARQIRRRPPPRPHAARMRTTGRLITP